MTETYKCVQVPREYVEAFAGLEWGRVVAAALADEIPGAILFHEIPKHVAPPDTAFLADRGIASIRSQGW